MRSCFVNFKHTNVWPPVCRTLGLLVLSDSLSTPSSRIFWRQVPQWLGASLLCTHVHAAQAGSRGSFALIWQALALQYSEQSTSNEQYSVARVSFSGTLWGGSLNRSPACKVGTLAPCQERPSRACVRYEAIKVGATHQSIDHDSGSRRTRFSSATFAIYATANPHFCVEGVVQVSTV